MTRSGPVLAAMAAAALSSARLLSQEETKKDMKEEVIFQDKLAGKLAEGWSWIREDRKGWRLSEQGLEIRVQPGNMWGKSNDAKNLLLRPAPDASGAGVVAEVTVKTEPTGQYEQAGLAWYHDDSHMVKLVKEMVDGKVHLVMGREEGDRTQTIALLPKDGATFHLRLQAKGNRVTGFFRTDEKSPWVEAGTCEVPGKGPAKVCLQAYNGPASAEHWSVFSNFVLSRGP